MFAQLQRFLTESMGEFSRIQWPDAQETIQMTIAVIGFSFVMAILLGVFDFAFLSGLQNLFNIL